jgi:hypothetical protein
MINGVSFRCAENVPRIVELDEKVDDGCSRFCCGSPITFLS